MLDINVLLVVNRYLH